MRSSPDVMSSRPTIIRSSVDFPHPDGPTRMTNSPSAMSRLTPLTAGNPSPYFLTMLSSVIDAITGLLGRAWGWGAAGSRACGAGAALGWSSLHRPLRQARDDLALEGQHEDHDGDGHDHRRGRDRTGGLLELGRAREERERRGHRTRGVG